MVKLCESATSNLILQLYHSASEPGRRGVAQNLESHTSAWSPIIPVEVGAQGMGRSRSATLSEKDATSLNMPGRTAHDATGFANIERVVSWRLGGEGAFQTGSHATGPAPRSAYGVY